MTSYAAILSLVGSSGASVDLSDNEASLTTAQAQALIDLGVTFAATDKVIVKDAAASIEALSAGPIASLATMGVSGVLANDRALALSVGQVNAFATANITASSQYETMSPSISTDVFVSSEPGYGGGEQIMGLADGSYVVVTTRTNYPVSADVSYAQRFDATGAAVGDAFKISGGGGIGAFQADTTLFADGSYMIVWSEDWQYLYGQRFDSAGNAQGGIFSLAPAISDGSYYPQFAAPQLTALSDGGYLLTTFDLTRYGLAAQRYDSNGAVVGAPTMLLQASSAAFTDSAEGTVMTYTVELSDGSVMIFHPGPDSTTSGVYAQIIDSSGVAVGGPIAVDPNATSSEFLSGVTQLSDGAFAVSWMNPAAISMRVYGADGSAITSEIIVNASSEMQSGVSITALAEGGFVVTWQLGNYGDVYSRAYDASGNALTDATLVNTTTEGIQGSPTVVALEDGGYVIIWNDLSSSAKGYEINGQLFDAEGNKIGAEFGVNVNEDGTQSFAKITALEGGGFAAVWFDLSMNQYFTRVYQPDTAAATLSATAEAISSLTVSDIANLPEMGITSIAVSDSGIVTFGKEVAVALSSLSGVSLTGSMLIQMIDTGAVIDDLTASEITKLGALGLRYIDVSDGAVTLTKTQVDALMAAWISFSSEDSVVMSLTPEDARNLTSGYMRALTSLGIDSLDLTADTSLSIATAQDIQQSGLTLVSGDVVTLADRGDAIETLSAAEIADLAAWGVDTIDLTDNAASLSVAAAKAMAAAGIAFASGDVVTISAPASDLLALDASDLASLSGLGVSRYIVTDTAAHIGGLSAAEIAALASMGVTLVVATDRAIGLDLDQTEALAAADMTVHSQYETMSAASTSSNIVATQLLSYSVEVTELADGSLLAVSLSRTSSGDYILVGQSVDASGAPIGAASTLVEVSGKRVVYFDVAALADGGFALSWRVNHSSGISTQAFSADGSALGAATQLTSTDAYQTQVTALSDGGYMVTWLVYSGTYAFHAQRFDASGNAVGSDTVLDSDVYLIAPDTKIYQSSQVVAMSDGSAMVVWISNSSGGSQVTAQIFDASGAAIDDAFTVSTSVTTYSNTLNAVTLASGDVVIAWVQDDASVRFMRYSALGEAQASPTIEATGSNGVIASDIAALDNGGFVMTWSILGATGSQETVMMRVYDSSGVAVTDATLVNTTNSTIEESPKVIALEDGGFVVVWRDFIGGSLGMVINAQIYDENGVAVGEELTVSAGATGGEILDIEPLDNGGFLVTFAAGASSGLRVFSRVFLPDTDVPTVNVTAAELSALSISDVADLSELGITSITVSDSGAVRLGKEAALALSAVKDVTLSGASSITVVGEGVSLDDLGASDIKALAALGVSSLDATDNSVTISLAQAQAMIEQGLHFASDDVVTITLTAAELDGLSSGDITDLATIGAETLDLTDAASISFARALDLAKAGLAFAAEDVVTLVDEGGNLEELSTSELGALVVLGVNSIDLSNDFINLKLEKAKSFAESGLAFASNDEVTVTATHAEVEALTVEDIEAIASIGVSRIFMSNTDAVDLSIEQVEALSAEGLAFAFKGVTVSLVATGAEIADLDATDVAAFAAVGINHFDASDDAVSLTMAQIETLSSAGIAFASGDTLSLLATATEFATLTAENLTAAAENGVTSVTSTSSTLDATIAQAAAMRSAGLTFADGLTARLSDTLSRMLALSSADLSAYKALGVDLARVSDTGAVIAAMTTATINTLDALGLDSLNATDGAVTISLAKANLLVQVGIPFESDNAVAVSASAATFADPDTLNLSDLASIHIDRIDVSDDAITLNYGAAKTYIDAGIGFTEADTVTVTLSYAQAMALTSTVGAALRAANVDSLQATMTGAQLASLSASSIATLAGKGVDVVDLSDNAASLTAAQVSALISGGVSLASSDVVALVDTGANIAALTVADISAYAALGVTSVNASDDALSLSLSQAQALVNAKISLTAPDAVTVTLTYDEASSLTTSQGSALLAAKVDTLEVSLTGAQLSALSAGGIAALAAKGVSVFDLSDDAASVTVAQADALISGGVTLTSPDALSVADTGAALAALTTSKISAYATLGVTSVNASDNVLSLSLSQAQALVNAGIALTSADAVTVTLTYAEASSLTTSQGSALLAAHVDLLEATMTGAQLAALSATGIAALAAKGVSVFDLSDDAASLTVAQIDALVDGKIALTSPDAVTVTDAGSAISALTTADISAYAALGVTSVNVSNDALSLSLAQAQALVNGKIALTSADAVTVTLTYAEASSLTTTQGSALLAAHVDTLQVGLTGKQLGGLYATGIAALAAKGVSVLDLSDDAASVTVAQVDALISGGVSLTSPDALSLVDTGAALAALTTSKISAYATLGVTSVNASDNVLSLSLGQAQALANAGIALTSADAVTVTLTYAEASSLTASQASALLAAHVDTLEASLTGAELAGLSAAGIATLAAKGISVFDLSDDAASLTVAQIHALVDGNIAITSSDALSLVDAGSAIASLTASDISAYAALGVTCIDASDDVLSFSLGQAQALVKAGVALTSDDAVTVTLSFDEASELTVSQGAVLLGADVDTLKATLTGAQLAGLSGSGIASFAGKGISIFDLSDGAAALTVAEVASLREAGIALASGDTITLVDSGAALAALTGGEISAFAALGVTSIDASDDALSLSLTTAQALVNAGIALTSADTVTVNLTYAEASALTDAEGAALLAAKVDTLEVEMTGAELEDLSASAITALANKGISVFDLSDNSASLTAAQMAALTEAHVSLVAPDAAVLVDTGANIAALTTAEIADLAGLGVTSVNASDDAMTLSLATAQALADAKIALTEGDAVTVRLTSAEASALSKSDAQALFAAHVDTLTVEMTGSELAGLSAGAITALADKGVSVFDLSDDAASLTSAQVKALADADVHFASPDALTLADTGAVIAGLSTATIATYAQLGVTAINASDNAITLSLAQASALLDRKIALTAADAVTVELSYAEAAALTPSQGAALLAANVDLLEATMTGAQAKALSSSQIAAQGASGIGMIDLSDNAVLLTSAQVKAYAKAGIDFASDDKVTQHAAPKLVADTVTVAEGKTAKVSVLANDTVFDGYDLSVTKADVSSGKGVVTIGKDGALSVRYTGPDIDGSATATVKVSYTATDGVETSRSTLTVTFTAVTEPLIGSSKVDKINGGSWADVIKGMGGNDILHGNGGADKIYGGDGNDRLFGDAGNDLLKGDAGNDRLSGGAGADDLYGGKGADVFLFSSLAELGKTKATADAIMDFSHLQHDIIDLSDIDANSKRGGNQDFTFIGSDKYSKTAGELRVDGDKSAYFLHGDIDGNGKDDFIIEIHSAAKLVKSDFDL
jgi:hypothetical protein